MKSLDSVSDEDQGNFLSGFDAEEYPADLIQSECAYENVMGGGQLSNRHHFGTHAMRPNLMINQERKFSTFYQNYGALIGAHQNQLDPSDKLTK